MTDELCTVPRVRLDRHALLIERLSVAGAAQKAAWERVGAGGDLETAVREMLEIGGAVLDHGASRATVDAVSAEVSRLTATLAAATEDALPRVFAAQAQQVSTTLAELFDAGRTTSVQEQIRVVLERSSRHWERELRRSLEETSGPLGRVRAELAAAFANMAARQEKLQLHVTTLTERLAARDAVAAERERGTAKGLSFELVLRQAVDRVFSAYADTVEDVSTSSGVDGGKKGDLLVTLNRDEAPRPARIVIEAKDRKLRLAAILEELKEAMENRDAVIGVAVFARLAEAPTNGQALRVHDDGRILCVFDDVHGRLPLEVALQLARALARAKAAHRPLAIDAAALRARTRRLATTIDRAKEIARGVNSARRGLDHVDSAYTQLRRDAQAELDAICSHLRDLDAAHV